MEQFAHFPICHSSLNENKHLKFYFKSCSWEIGWKWGSISSICCAKPLQHYYILKDATLSSSFSVGHTRMENVDFFFVEKGEKKWLPRKSDVRWHESFGLNNTTCIFIPSGWHVSVLVMVSNNLFFYISSRHISSSFFMFTKPIVSTKLSFPLSNEFHYGVDLFIEHGLL